MSTDVSARRIRELMFERGWGVKAFAARIPADKNSVKTWLAGKYYPRYDSLVKVATLFGVSTDYLVGLSENRDNVHTAVPLVCVREEYLRRVKMRLLSSEKSEETYAQQLGVKPSTVENWFLGRKFPEMTLIIQSARVLGCSLDYLLGRSNSVD